MAPGALSPIDTSLSGHANADLILIPGPDSPPVKQWEILSPRWRRFLSKTDSKIRFFAYDCDGDLRESFSWPLFLSEGKVLLDGLCRNLEEAQPPRLLSFMCHGLGGFLLKQALCIANAQPDRYEIVLSSIVGIAFLGVPHAASNPTLLIERSILLLRSTQVTLSKQSLSRLEKEANFLTDISKLFEDIKLRVAVLSVFETKDTKVKAGLLEGKRLFSSSKKFILVDEELAKTNSISEQMLGFSCEHADLCRLQTGSVSNLELENWFAFVFGEKCRSGVQRKLELLRDSPSPVTSMSSYDAARKALSGEVDRFYISPAQTTSLDPTLDSSGVQGWDVVPLVNSFTPTRRFAKLPCFMIDTLVRNRDFFARESLMKQLDEALLPPQNLTFSSEHEKQRHAVLCGLGGLGKTSIAMEFMFSRKDKFDAVFWIPADEPSKPDRGFCKIASTLGLEDDSEPQNPIISRGLAKGWLESPRKVLDQGSGLVGQTEANWLLIFDNADKPDILQDYWPISCNGSILVTSRDPRSKLVPSVISNDIEVPLLDDEEAAVMLRKLSRVSKDPAGSLKIARKLNGLPLAVEQMAGIIQHQYMSFAEFLERYEDDEDRRELHAFEAGKSRQETRGNVSTIWFVDQLDPPPRTLLEICAVLDPDCIQERIFSTGVSKINHLEAYPASNFAYVAARTELIKRSLVSRNEEKREFWVHRILQDAVLSKMPEERTQAIFSAAVRLVSDAWGPIDLTKRHDIELSKSRMGLFPHALSLKTIYQKYSFLRDRETSLLLGALMNEGGWWQHERGNSHDIKALLILAEEICAQFPGKEATQLLCDVHYGLAAVANETNDRETCLRRTKMLLDMRRKIFEESGTPDLRLAIAHNEHAIALVMNHDYNGAVDDFSRSISVYKSLENYWPGIDTNPRTNVGFALWALGRLEEAHSMLHDLLMDREVRFGVMDTESFRTGRVLKGLAQVTLSQGRVTESEEYDKRALAQWQGSIGSNHHKTADGCIGVAKHCMRHLDFKNASELLDQALRIYRFRPDVYKPQIARVLFIKARLAALTGSEEEGMAFFKEAKNLRNEIPWAPEKADSELREPDFEELIILWSR